MSVCRCLGLNYSSLSVLAPTEFKRFLDHKSLKDRSGFSHPMPFSMLACTQPPHILFANFKLKSPPMPNGNEEGFEKGKDFLLTNKLNKT